MKPLLLFVVLLPAVSAVFMGVMSLVMPPVFRHPEPLLQPAAGHENSLAAMLVGLVFTMAAFLTGFGWLIVRGWRRRADKPMAVPVPRPPAPPAATRTRPRPGEESAPWERPADWWKAADE